MSRNQKLLCWAYAAIAAVALYATWSHNIAFASQVDSGGTLGFIRAAYANHASASIANDLVFFGLAAFVFMLAEARRLKMRFVWVYVALSLLIAIAAIFPLFLIARQRKLCDAENAIRRSA